MGRFALHTGSVVAGTMRVVGTVVANIVVDLCGR